MIFQEPMSSLNPVYTIGFQIQEAIRLHQNPDKKESWAQAIDMLDQVGMPNPARIASSYPHELSGGMRQRAMIAMALSCHPALLIADEPTTQAPVHPVAAALDPQDRRGRAHTAGGDQGLGPRSLYEGARVQLPSAVP